MKYVAKNGQVQVLEGTICTLAFDEAPLAESRATGLILAFSPYFAFNELNEKGLTAASALLKIPFSDSD
jgi:hypothetical protein